MGDLDTVIYDGKSVEKNLTLLFEEGDDVIQGMKKAIQEHNIKEARAVSADGELQDAVIQYFIHHKFSTHQLKNGRIINVSGRFLNLKDGIYGDLKVSFLLGMQMWNGTLTKAKAKKGFQLTLKFREKIEEAGKGLGGIKY
jgi:hypothetical protein